MGGQTEKERTSVCAHKTEGEREREQVRKCAKRWAGWRGVRVSARRVSSEQEQAHLQSP